MVNITIDFRIIHSYSTFLISQYKEVYNTPVLGWKFIWVCASRFRTVCEIEILSTWWNSNITQTTLMSTSGHFSFTTYSSKGKHNKSSSLHSTSLYSCWLRRERECLLFLLASSVRSIFFLLTLFNNLEIKVEKTRSFYFFFSFGNLLDWKH